MPKVVSMTKKVVISLLIALLIFALTLLSYSEGLFDRPEFFFYDMQVQLLRSHKTLDRSKIKVVLVDDASLTAMSELVGRWPWPRAIWADLLEFLTTYGNARAVLFDIVFLERHDEVNDRSLLDATMASQNVYHSMIIKQEVPDKKRIASEMNRPLPADFISRFALKDVKVSPSVRPHSEYNDYSLPIAGLPEASKGMAVVEFAKDSDAVYRRTRPIREYQGRFFPVLGVAPFVDSATPVTVQQNSITIGDRTIPVDDNGNVTINMYDLNSVEPYSISGLFASLQKIRTGDVESLPVNPEEFKDSIVFIGASAVGTHDLKALPVSPSAPGVMLHVFMANNYIQNDFMRPPGRRLTILSIVIGAFLSSLVVMLSKRFLIRAMFPFIMLGVFIGYAVFSFMSNRQVEMVPFIVSTVSTSFLSFGYLTFTEAAEKRRLSNLFSQYVSKDVLNEVLHNYKEYLKTSIGQKVEITVLFSDIRGFTTMSENTSPEKIVEMLNIHFTEMADVILKHNGTIDKYIGDAIMAFWGAPVRTEDHAEQAVQAAQEMLEKLEDVNKALRERGFAHEIRIGIGIHTGVATIGNIGSEKKKNYTIVGDTVNLASRLEGVTKEYQTPLLLSEDTYEKIKQSKDCKLMGNVRVKGREQPVTIYTIERIAVPPADE
jgi:adenylate cyclase